MKHPLFAPFFAKCSLAAAVAAGGMGAAQGSLYGTMSNFDVYNETETEAHGAEIELEGIHLEDLSRTFPSHFDHENRVEYQEGTRFGVRITYDGYNLDPSGFLAPQVNPPSTNGHTCVNTQGCEHFGFSVVGVQPTAARYYWLDGVGQRIGNAPMAVPTPTWNYQAAAGGGAMLRAAVEVPEPPEVIEQKPDSIWMKVFKIEIDRPVDLMELMSGNAIVPDGEGQVESEWELLEGGKMDEAEDEIDEDHYAIVRRYEYYEYTGPYDEENEPTSLFLDQDLPEPPDGELGQFIAANMVAANLAAPEEGDFDQDGDVDGGNFLAWQSGFGDDRAKLQNGDADWNDEVDGEDLAIWERQFGNAEQPAAAQAQSAAVPEPTSIALAGLFAAALLGARASCPGRRRSSPHSG